MGNATPDQMMSQMESILSNPAMANMMQSMMSNPAVMQQMIDSDPRMRAMLDAAPGMREQLTNPEFLRQMTNPDNLRAMMQMQRAMTQLQGNGVMPGMGMPGAGGGSGAGAANPFAALMGGAQPSYVAFAKGERRRRRRHPGRSCSNSRIWAFSTRRKTSGLCRRRSET